MYGVSAVGGTALSYIMSPNPSVGASGQCNFGIKKGGFLICTGFKRHICLSYYAYEGALLIEGERATLHDTAFGKEAKFAGGLKRGLGACTYS